MCFSARLLAVAVLVNLSLAASLCAQSTAKQPVKTPTGSVSGRVTIKERGAAGVTVGLRKTEITMPFDQPTQRATTDQEGFYRITNVPAGNYEVIPSAPAYVMADGISRTKSVLVGEDENVESINFSLIRGGVITGRVNDADGRPVIQQQVSIYQYNAFDQVTPQRPAFAIAYAQTDDRGIYRVFGLNVGKYKVAAGRSDDSINTNFGPSRFVYKQVFHPDASDQSRATVIDVSEGSEANNVDINLGRALQTFSVSGRVVDEKGVSVSNLRFTFQRSTGQRFEFINAMGTSNSVGDFVVEGLIPGKYSVYLIPNLNEGLRADSLSFDIIDQDVSGVTIRLSKGATISGIVVLETEDKAALAKVSELQLRAFVAQTSAAFSTGGSSMSPVGPDGSFRLAGLPGGSANLNLGAVNSPLPPKGFVITRIERDGMIQPRTIEIKDGEQVTGVRVIVSVGTAAIRGVVILENGSMPEGSRLFVRLMKPGEQFLNFRPPPVDARGRFLLEAIPAGTYDVIVTMMGAQGIQPRFAKKEVTVQEGLTTDVTLTIDMNAPVTRNP
jgi:carboxypeptidase family protein